MLASRVSTARTPERTDPPSRRVTRPSNSAASFNYKSHSPQQNNRIPQIVNCSDDPDEILYDIHRPTGPNAPYAERISGVVKQIKKAKYATSVDDRGYLSVFEYPLKDHAVMWDYTSGYVHLTGIWKGLGNQKADVVKLLENHPELQGLIVRIRGGYLKIQGTWVPFDVAKRLAERTCYEIRYTLVPIFGPDFPDACLTPDHAGYGTLTLDDSGLKKRRRRSSQPGGANKAPRLIAPKNVPEAVLEDNDADRVPEKPRLVPADRKTRKRSRYEELTELADAATAKRVKYTYVTPPPLPETIVLEAETSTTDELTQLLCASRSLQLLSAGPTVRWSFDQSRGGEFEYLGRRWRWDGERTLTNIASASPALTSSSFDPLDNVLPTDDVAISSASEAEDDEVPVEVPELVATGGVEGSPSVRSELDIITPPPVRAVPVQVQGHGYGLGVMSIGGIMAAPAKPVPSGFRMPGGIDVVNW
ncbi:hypothetical protein YB2330_004393 [Saitoella coloradoensis]